jgi:hypothetical protein
MFAHYKTLLLPLIFSSIFFVSGCGRSSPDAKDEPTMMDTMRYEVFGNPLYLPLDTLNQEFHGKINASALNDSDFAIKLFSTPSSRSESIRHNIDLKIVGEMMIGNQLFADTGGNTHVNWLRREGTHPALKSRQFIEFSPTIVMPSNYRESDVILEPIKEYEDNNKSLNQKFDGENPPISLKFIAELKGDHLVSGVIRATRCPTAGGICWQEDVGSWGATRTASAIPEVLDDDSIRSDKFTFTNLVDGNIRTTVVKLNK